MTRINTNVSSLVAQNRLNRTNLELNTSLTRLSTGLRINTGKDDPAGLIASEALRSDITSINKAITNTQRANQVIATADSALGQVSSLLNDIRGLVVEAANSGALSDDEIAANQLQVDSSLQAINRISQTTTFQGRKLLDGSLDFITTAGTNFTSITNLQINQANLGSVGSVALDIQISRAATRAEVNVGNIPAAGDAGIGTLTLDNNTPAVEAVTQSLVTAIGPGDYTIGAKDGSAIDGTAGNSVVVNIQAGATTATASAETTVQATGAGGDFSVSVKSTSTTYAGSLGNALDVDIAAGNTATAQANSALQDVNGVTGAYQIRAKAGGAFDGVAGNAVTFTVNSNTGVTDASVVGNALTIDVDDSSSLSLADLKTALEADGDFNNDFEFVITSGSESELFRSDGSDDVAAVALNGASSGTDAAATYSFAGTTLTITIDDNTARNLSEVKAALDLDASFASDFDFNVGVDATFAIAGTDDAAGVALAGGDNAVAEATFANNILNITVTDSADQTLANIQTALAAITDFNDNFDFTINNAGSFASAGTDDVTNEALNSGTVGTDTTVQDVITITGPSGVANNGTLSVVQSAAVTTPTAAVDEDGNVTVTVSDTASTALSDIVTAIDGLSGYSSSITTAAGDAIFAPATDAFTTVDISGATDGGIAEDVVFELVGADGSQVFEISAGTSIDQLVAQINLVSEATGIAASANIDTLEIQSTAYGTNAFVDLRIIDEDPAGTFTSEVGVRARDEGADVTAKINGVDASGDGNKFKVKNSSLDIEIQVSDGFSGSIDFNITGGGANFQLGPEVVTNQQARIGINSVNTARLGGVTGKLYQLAEGGNASLDTNTRLASTIVDEAVNQVTSLRGRLGAFQATTLESNLVSLNDTVVNLTEAESSIRDADFAAESARLTRAQILVQSGTSVLGIANQNPQNVLSLLR